MLMATPLGQTVTVQEVSTELKARGYYPLDTTPLPSVSPVQYELTLGPVSPAVSPPADEGWITDRYPPGYIDPNLAPAVSLPVLYFKEPDLPISPSIYEEFITRAQQPVFQRVEMEVTYEPPVSPPLDVIFPELPLDLLPLEPELPVSPPPGFIIQEFPDLLPDIQLPISPPDDFVPVSPIPGIPPPEEKKGAWWIIAVLGAAVLLGGEEKKPVRKPAAELRRKEQWI